MVIKRVFKLDHKRLELRDSLGVNFGGVDSEVKLIRSLFIKSDGLTSKFIESVMNSNWNEREQAYILFQAGKLFTMDHYHGGESI